VFSKQLQPSLFVRIKSAVMEQLVRQHAQQVQQLWKIRRLKKLASNAWDCICQLDGVPLFGPVCTRLDPPDFAHQLARANDSAQLGLFVKCLSSHAESFP